jgi:hypothetical protein
LFKADSPGLPSGIENFSNLKVQERYVGDEGHSKITETAYGIDGRARGGLLFAEPTSYIRGKEGLASYEWLNGPPSYDACKHMPRWLADIVMSGGIANPEQMITTCNANVSLGTDAEQMVVDLEARETANRTNDCALSLSSESVEKPPAEGNTVALLGLHAALVAIGEMMQKALAGDQSRFNGVGVQTSTGWQLLKSKTVGTRTCMNVCKHVSNNFSILCNGGVLLYRCLSSECVKIPDRLLGIFYWPECLPLRADRGFITASERYMLPFVPPKDDEGHRKKGKEVDRTKKAEADLHDLILRMMNHYYGVVIDTTRAVYLETIYSRDGSGRLQREETTNRSGHNFLERCKNLQLRSLPSKSKEVAKWWESNSKRHEYDQIVFEPDMSKVSPRHFNLFCGLKFQRVEHKLTESELVECEKRISKLI